MQLYLNFSLITGTWVMEALCRKRASLWEQIPLLEPSTRRWCRTPRRWTCPALSQQHPSGCVTWGRTLSSTWTKKEFYNCCWTKWQKNILRQVLFCEPTHQSNEWSSGESRLHSTWTCWNISGSYQRQSPVFCSDNTFTNASVDEQTRSTDSHEIQCEKGGTHE